MFDNYVIETLGINDDYNPPVIKCAKYSKYGNNFEYLKYLLKNGYDINIKNKYNNTALLFAVYESTRHSNLDTIKYLIENGANINDKDIEGRTTLILSCYNLHQTDNNNIETIKYLTEKCTNINDKDNYGNTVLYYALAYSKNNLEIIKYLIEKGSNINNKNIYNETPLMIAIKNIDNNIDTFKLLIKKGANINHINNNGHTALMFLCEKGLHIDLIKLMLEYNANIYVNEINIVNKLQKKYGINSEIYKCVFNFKIIKNHNQINYDFKIIYQ